jgi:hypothetical protein
MFYIRRRIKTGEIVEKSSMLFHLSGIEAGKKTQRLWISSTCAPSARSTMKSTGSYATSM